MEELFDNIFVLVPVALLIFLRVFGEGARKRAEKAKKTSATVAPAVQSSPAVQSRPAVQASPAGHARPEPRERPWYATPKADSRERDAPSAGQAKPAGQAGVAKWTVPARRDLIGRLRNYFSGALEQPNERQEPLHFEEEAARRLGQFGTRTTASPGTKPQVKSGYKEGLPGAMEESAAVTREPVVPYTFPERLERMPTLKRAIILSEVLGKPKSMQ